MDSAARIQRINELAKLSKQRSLTAEEQQEQAKLRVEYLDEFRNRFRKQLENIDIVREDGSISPMIKKGSLLH